MLRLCQTSDLRRQLLAHALTIFVLALVIVAGTSALRAGGFVLTFPMPVTH